MSAPADSEASLRLARALMRLQASRGTQEEARWAREVKQAEQALSQPTPAPAPAERRCSCGGQLLAVAGRRVCALGTHDD